MRRLLGVGLAAVACLGEAYADPATPQINPLHRQREDAQRLIEQQRGLGRERPPDPAPVPVPNKAPPMPGGGNKGAVAVGVVLIGIGGVTALTAAPLLLFQATKSDDTPDTFGAAPAVLTIAAVVTGATGLALVLNNRSVKVSPTVSANAVGLTIMGRM